MFQETWKKHVLLCKMSPASHFFFFEKGKKNNIRNLFTIVVKKHFWQTFCPASCSWCIFKNSDSHGQKGFFTRLHVIACDCMRLLAIACNHIDCMRLHAIACNRLRSLAIAWQSVRSWVTYNKEDWIRQIKLKLLPLPPSLIVSLFCRCAVPSSQKTLHLVRCVVSHCTAKLPSQHPVVSSIASSYRPSSRCHIRCRVITRCHTSSRSTVTLLYHCRCHAPA